MKKFDYVAKENFYDKNGLLLLSKGQNLTEDIVLKLKNLSGYGAKVETNDNELIDNIFYNEIDEKSRSSPYIIVKTFNERYKLRNDKSLEKTNKLLNAIIFESRDSSWWIFVNALCNYVDWVYTHSIDVAMISTLIASELNITGNQLWNLSLGAFLHDVGKLLIPKKIIQKEGSLSNLEMLMMQQHCDLGFSSLEHYNLHEDIYDIVLQHHERLDGSGYPNNLVGDQISLNAKIVMLADTIDAITSSRPYKQPQNMEDAINIILTEKTKYPHELSLIFRDLFICD